MCLQNLFELNINLSTKVTFQFLSRESKFVSAVGTNSEFRSLNPYTLIWTGPEISPEGADPYWRPISFKVNMN
jgi:hypothetical protein